MRKKVSLLALVVFSCIAASAQYSVKIVLDAIPPKHPDDAMFLTGDYNQWTPNDQNSQFVKDATGKFVATFTNVPANSYEIKVTRGTDKTIECAADGKALDSRKVTINSDTTFHLTVAGWSDDFAKNTLNAPASGAPTVGAPAYGAYLNRKVVPSVAR